MNQSTAIAGFAALAHDARLSVFRVLVQHAPKGIPAMEIGRILDIKPSTLSGHLAALKRAGLITVRRQHRELHYAPDLSCMNALVLFLLQDCCAGHSEACSGLATSLQADVGP